jgi:hypothetical protein
MRKVIVKARKNRNQILLIKARHSGVVESALLGLRISTVDLTRPTIYFSLRFFLNYFRLSKTMNKDVAYLLTIIQHIQPKVVISTDSLVTMKRRSMLHELSVNYQDATYISVPHGSYQKGYEFHPVDELTGEELQVKSKVVLASLGARDISSYNRWGMNHEKVVPVGSLPNSIYLRDRLTSPPLKTLQICIVEHLGDPSKNSLPLQSKALQAIEVLCEYVDAYALKNKIKIKIALRPTSKALFESDDEIGWVLSWFRQKFKTEISFTDSTVDFATHIASDESQLTVGVDSTALLESIARGNKVLTIWYDDSPLGIPNNNWLFLKNPSYGDFESTVDRILKTSDAEYLGITQFDREHLIECRNGSNAIANLLNLVTDSL